MRVLLILQGLFVSFPWAEGGAKSQVVELSGRFPDHLLVQDERLFQFQNPNLVYDYEDEVPRGTSHTREGQTPHPNANANYEFSYGVHDDEHGTAYSRKETADSGGTQGQYQVQLPDGRTQIVSYTADENGYRAEVTYKGEAVHDVSHTHNDQPEPHHHPQPNIHSHPGTHPNAIPFHQVQKLEDEPQIVHPIPHPLHQEGHFPLGFQGPTHILHHPGRFQKLFLHDDDNDAVRLVKDESQATPTPLNEELHHPPPPFLLRNNLEHGSALHFGPTQPSFSAVGPAPTPGSHHRPFITAPFQSPTPHPHPIIRTHNPPSLPRKFPPNGITSFRTPGFGASRPTFPGPKPIIKSRARNHFGNAAHRPIFRNNIARGKRYAQGTNFEEYSTSSPIF